jgi:hypothetical protein
MFSALCEMRRGRLSEKVDFGRRSIRVKRLLRLVVFVLVAIYVLMSAVLRAVVNPIADWIAEHWISERLAKWIVALPPYPTLALFALPLIVLEPVKPVAAYLAATNHIALGLTALVVGELLKFFLVERLFSVNHEKLMSIPAFARAHGRYRHVRDWLESTWVWLAMRRLNSVVQYATRSYASGV